MLIKSLKNYPKLFLVYFVYMLFLFIIVSVFVLLVLRFFDFRFLLKENNTLSYVFNFVSSVNSRYKETHPEYKYRDLNKDLKRDFNFIDDSIKNKVQYNVINETKYRVCINFYTSYSFRKPYGLTLDLYHKYFGFSTNDNIILEKTSGESDNYIDCYIIEL